jgi:hypothetical protein
MALDIWLKGKFRMNSVYNYVRSHQAPKQEMDPDDLEFASMVKDKDRFFYTVSDVNKGNFTFHLYGIKDVTYQIYAGGSIRIIGDDHSDYKALLYILYRTIKLATGELPNLSLESIQPLPTTVWNIGRLSVNDVLEDRVGASDTKIHELAKIDAERIKQVRFYVNEMSGLMSNAGAICQK